MTALTREWMRHPAMSFDVDGARVGVSPDRVVHVDTEGLFRTVQDWAVVAALGGAPKWWDRAEVLQRALDLIPAIPTEDLVEASVAGPPRRAEIARECRPGSPALALLAADRSERVVEAAVTRMGGSAWEKALLLRLGLDPQVYWQVGVALAKNPHTPDEALVALAALNDPLIRAPLAERVTPLPVAAQEHLVTDDDADIREALGRAPGLADHVAQELAMDQYARVREAIARRDDCPPNALADLAVDTDSLVRAQALVRIRRDYAENADVTSTPPPSPGRPHRWRLVGVDGWTR